MHRHDAGACRANFDLRERHHRDCTLNGFRVRRSASCISGAFTNDEPATRPAVRPPPRAAARRSSPAPRTTARAAAAKPDASRARRRTRVAGAAWPARPAAPQKCTEEGQCHEPCGPNNCKLPRRRQLHPGETTTSAAARRGLHEVRRGQPGARLRGPEVPTARARRRARRAAAPRRAASPGPPPRHAASTPARATCGYGKQCTNHACVLTPAFWDVVVTGADIPAKKLNDSGDWDPVSRRPRSLREALTEPGADSHTGRPRSRPTTCIRRGPRRSR